MIPTRHIDLTVKLGPAQADCAKCDLKGSRDLKGCLAAEVTPRWKAGGIMLVGESPTVQDFAQKRPLVARAGSLLDALLREAGIDREDCVVSLATICMTPRTEVPGALIERFPNAVPSCMPRLDAEVAHYRPRVIIALGAAALAALTGYHQTTKSREPFDCSLCGPSTVGVSRSKKCPECLGYKTKEVETTNFLCDHKIMQIAGTVLPTETCASRYDEYGVKYIIPTLHPSLILRGAEANKGAALGGQFLAPAVIEHFRKAKRLLSRDAVYKVEVEVTADPERVREYFDRPGAFAIDIETPSAEVAEINEVLCLGVCHEDETTSLVIDTREIQPALLAACDAVLSNPAIPKVLHNRLFDETVIERVWGVMTQGTIADTMQRQRILYPDEPAKLQWVAARYTDAPPWKTKTHPTFEDLALYNARDTWATKEIWKRQAPEVPEMQMVVDVDDACTEIALQMQADGVPVNLSRLGEIEKIEGAKAAAALADMQRHVVDYDISRLFEGKKKKKKKKPANGELVVEEEPEPEEEPDTWSPHSQKHLIWALFDPAGPCRLVPPVRTETGAPSTAKDALARLRGAHPFVESLLVFRKSDKLVSVYCRGSGIKISPKTGRLHPQWMPGGARTGRWTSSDPGFQNWPEIMRGIIETREGRVFVGADESQLELRVLGWLCGDAELIRRCLEADESDKLNPDRDPHSYVASVAFGEAFMKGDKIRRKALRDLAKTVIYAINYGAGAQKILDGIQTNPKYEGPPVRLDVVQRIIATIFRVFPGISKWRDQQLIIAERTGEVRSELHGRRRVYPLGEVDATVAWNFPIQSTAADLVNDSLILFYRKLHLVDPTAFVIAQVHDAIYAECDEAKAPAVAKLLEQCMTHTLEGINGAPAMRFEATAKIDRNWGKL